MYTNYYNPYLMNRKKFNLKNINFNKILTNTSKTLNVINQAIPIYYQVKPIISNAKTLLRVASIIKSDPVSTNAINNIVDNATTSSNNPTFFL